jgi:acyl-CoA reductase-like NAD-dependent aldehyde dehydrogenase
VISAKQRARVRGYIQKGIDEGAKLLVGGTEAPAGRDQGFWVRPTLFVDVDNRMTIAQEEIFGPVLVVIPFTDEQDAIRIANDSAYGLAGNVMTGSLERGLAVARRLRAGFIGVGGTAPYGADVPFGGSPEETHVCSCSTTSRTSGASTTPSPATCATRTAGWPRCGV